MTKQHFIALADSIRADGTFTPEQIHARNEELTELLNAIVLWIEADMRRTPPPKGSMAAHFLPAFCKNARKALTA